MSKPENASAAAPPFRRSVSGAAALVLLFSVAALVEAVWSSSLHNVDVWLHLRVGDWILVNKSWPTAGLFSQASSLPWRDFSWAGDALSAAAVRVLGLSAAPALWMLYRWCVAVVTFLLARGSRENFVVPAMISGLAQYLLYDMGPLGAGSSAICFAIELIVLRQVRTSGDYRRLFLLVPLFAFWANVDLGIVYGAGLLVLFYVAMLVERLGSSEKSKLTTHAAPENASATSTAVWAGGAGLLATLLSPYGYHCYNAFWAVQASPANRYLAAHTAMSFHQPQDYLLLLLVMSAFLSLGLRHSRDIFLLSALVASAALSFRAQGENWLAVLAAVAVIGDGIRRELRQEADARSLWSWFTIAAGSSFALIVLAYFLLVFQERADLMRRVAADLPVAACNSIREHHLPAPIFNAYHWGSFLTWYLPEYPVAIDGRRGLYPDTEETDYFRVMRVLIPYQSLPSMQQARTLLFDKQNVVGEALRKLPGFQVVYEDGIAVVLVRQ